MLAKGKSIGVEHLPDKLLTGNPGADDEPDSPARAAVSGTGSIPAKQSEKAALVEALHQADGNQTRAADILGVSRVTVWKRMKKHGITLKTLEK